MASSDPLNLLTNPPSTVVKVQGTARDDMNGQKGIAVQFNASRGRYIVHMTDTQTTMALKPENLVKASTIETYMAQFQQLYKDPRLKQEISKVYAKAHSVLGVKPEYGALALVVALVALSYFVGVTKVMVVISMLLLVGIVVAPDLGSPPAVMARNFPHRCRETMEQSLPFLKGRLSNKMAAGVVLVMLFMSGRVLFNAGATTKPMSRSSTTAPTTTRTASSAAAIEDAYRLGFEDATNAKIFGASLSTASTKSATTVADDDDLDPLDYYPSQAPPPSTSSPFGFSQLMALFYVGRTAYDLGNDPSGFSVARAMANLQTMEVWKMGMLGFSLYNLVKPFL